MTPEERRRKIFSLIERITEEIDYDDVIQFYTNLYAIYRSDPGEFTITPENLTKKETIILRRFLPRASEIMRDDITVQLCARSPYSRSALSGAVYFRLELLPILCAGFSNRRIKQFFNQLVESEAKMRLPMCASQISVKFGMKHITKDDELVDPPEGHVWWGLPHYCTTIDMKTEYELTD